MKSLKERNKTSLTLVEKIMKVLINYVTTQFVLMVITSLAVWGILSLLKVKYAVILAVLTGVSSAIPNFGIIFSSIVVTLVTIFDGTTFLPSLPPLLEGIIVLAFILLLNKLVDLVLAPFLLSKANKINPLLLIITVILGTALFGIAGAVLSVPLVLVIKTVLEHYSK